MATDVLSLEDIKKELGGSDKKTITDIPELIKHFVQKSKIERLSKVRIQEIDKISQMLFFGIRHTAFLNSDKYKDTNYMNIQYTDLKISSILEYTLINLSVRLSEESESRRDIKEMITSLITKEIDLMRREKNDEQD